MERQLLIATMKEPEKERPIVGAEKVPVSFSHSMLFLCISLCLSPLLPVPLFLSLFSCSHLFVIYETMKRKKAIFYDP